MKKQNQYLRTLLGSATLTISVVAGQSVMLPSVVHAQTAPGVNLPAPSIIDSGSNVVFSAVNGNAVTVSGNGTDTVVVELTVDPTMGTLLVNNTSALVTVFDDNSANVTLIGQEANINSVLDGLTLIVAAGHDCSDALSLDVKLKSFADAGFINGGFESPAFTGTFYQTDEANIPGWYTSATDSEIEIWHDGFKGVPSHTGDLFAEINANQVAALSHELVPVAGATELMFTFAHRGRAGIDTTAVIATDLGPDGIIGGVDDTVLFSQHFSTDNVAWSQHYVQLGAVSGNTILLRFDSISAAGGSSSGNFIDSVNIFDTPIIAQAAVDLSFDNDNDMVANGADLDDDNDGVLDINDNNGVNVCDLDSDNDGISDLIESSSGASAFDANGDGIYDGLVDANGIPVDANGGMLVDTDGDGVNDHHDLDSDNDGLTDTFEAGGPDADGDGIIDGYSDTNGDGWHDSTQVTNLPTADFDGDGALDYLDTDSDDDGLSDTNEAGGLDADSDGTIDTFVDANGDGLDDSIGGSPLSLLDADGDGQPDHLDVQSLPPVATDDVTTVPADTVASIDLSDNITDPDGDADVATIDLDPSTPGIQNTLTTADGVWSVDPVGVLSFDPAPAFEGVATIPYVVSDAAGNVSANADVYVTVQGAAPVATADSATTPADTSVSVALANNVSDVNNDVDITTIDLDPSTPGIQNTLTTADGVWTVGAAGVVTFDPAPGFQGTATIPYTVSDDDGNVSVPANVSVAVGGAAPVATADSATTAADTLVTVALADNVSDPNNDVALNTIDLDPSTTGIENTLTTPEGVWSVNAAGDLSFDPDPAFEGVATIPYTVSDDDGNVAIPSSVSVTVSGATPVATDDAAAVTAGGIAAIDLSDNISDDNNDEDVATIDLDPSTPGLQSTITTPEGTWSVDPAGTLSFTPAPGFQGMAALPYSVSDDDGNVSAPAIVTVTVGSAAPIADADSATTVQDTDVVIDVLDGDIDANNDIAAATLDLDPTTPGVQSTLTVPGEGTFTVVAGMVVFDPDADFSGVSTLDYTVSDASGNVSNVAVATVDVQIDTDGDGIPDADDLDDDNDGIPDLMEGTFDSDGDGMPDSLDLDSDDDGLTDAFEAGGSDTDGDGIIDGFTDTDGDGLDDATAATPLSVPDTDGDGNADYVDVDSDNDGMTDTAEAGGVDADGDGIIDGFTDVNGDGLDDATAATPLPGPDFDGDGVVDHLDIDSDNDGITDALEAGGVDADGDGQVDGFTDIDGDGLDDAAEILVPNGGADTDNDGSPDHLDLDADGDGIPDSVEAGVNSAVPADTDGDGTPDFLELDSDNDGIPDSVEAGSNPSIPVDTDGDGAPDFLEPDSDNDGIPDSVEAGSNPTVPVDTDGDGTPDFLEPDSDNDGIPDSVEAGSNPTVPVDTDGDGTPDFLEPDSDNDGIPDTLEAGVNPNVPVDTDGDGTPDFLEPDSDNDGIPDSVEAGPNPTAPVDTDGDSVPDFLELDSDDDGIADDVEAGPNPAVPVDSDADGTPDYLETDPAPGPQPNPVPVPTILDSDGDGILNSVEGTGDTDGDGTPDYLDEDSDNDGIPDSYETLIDTDADGVSDYVDIDADNDGISDALEQARDTDADGVEDFRDLDVDNDGIYDLIEARIGQIGVKQIDINNDGIVDISNAYGTNGMADIVETAPDSGVENYSLPDIDSDGVLDFRDLDSDNDGLLDTEESDHDDENLNGLLDTVSALTRTVLAVNAAGLGPDAGGLPRNTDGDALADFRDGDSDNDGILDIVESFGIAFDVDNDAMVDDFVDNNGDGVDDNWLSVPRPRSDSDDDGNIDAIEIDADGDGIADIIESGSVDADGNGTIDGFTDDDVDGIDDTVAVVRSPITDSDADGTPDFKELDSDNDGLNDIDETNGVDANGDGRADSQVLVAIPPDTDGDGTPDYQEFDGADPVQPINAAPTGNSPVGIIKTGLDGGTGCAISPTLLNNSRSPQKVDPMLPMISMLALMGLAFRRRSGLVIKKAGRATTVAAIAIGSLFLGGCTSYSGRGALDDLPGQQDSFASVESRVDNDDRLSFGIYAVAGIGASHLEPDTSEVPGWDPDERVVPAGQITLGADLTKHLSIEAHSADLGSAGLSPSGRINYHIDGLSALLYAGGNRDRYKRQGLTAFGRLGYGVLENSPVGDVTFEKVNGTHVLLGAGLEYMTSFGVGLRAEGITFDSDVHYAQLGLMYRVGRKERAQLPPLAEMPQPIRIEQPVEVAAAAPPLPTPATDACDALGGVLEGVNFHTDKADLTTESTMILNEIAYTLSNCADMQIEVSAHTDSVGAESYNHGLSRKRAVSVVRYLSERGLDTGRFSARAYGETSPIDTNDTAEGRARNRRVELYAR